MSDLEHQPKEYYDSQGTQLPPFEIKSPSPDFGDDLQGTRIREANRAIEEAKKRRTKRNILIGAGSAAAALALVVPLSLKGGSGHDTAPKAEATASAPANPSENSMDKAGTFTQPTPLEVSKYKDGAQLVRAWNDEFGYWMMAGGTQANADARYNSDNPNGSFIDGVVNPINKAYTDTFLVSDWESRPQLANDIRSLEGTHRAVVVVNLSTRATHGNHDPADKEPYDISYTVDRPVQVISSSPTEIVATWHAKVSDNSDKNHAGELMTQPINDTFEQATITWVDENGIWKIQDMGVDPGN